MLESAQNVYNILKAVQLYPEVMLAALAAYFITRQRYDASAKWAIWVPVGISFVGQLAFSWPKTAQDLFMGFTMGWVQAGMAIGAYSFLDKYGITDRMGRIVQKKLEDKGADNANPANGAAS